MSHFVDYTDGQIIPGTPYRVLARLGAGGMGVVYKVEDTSVEKVYVLKTLQSVHGSSSGLADLLRKEAKTLGKFKHPNIVEVYTAGQTADGLAYFVMEELEGCTLGALLEGVGPLPFSFVWQIGREICEALFYVHHPSNGSPVVIHRDIKPENIFLAKRATKTRDVRDPIPYLVKLLDFGISAVVDGERSKGFNGTLLYAAPEQLLNEPLTPLVDLYALGCVLFQMLTGRHPFVDAQTEMELIQCHLVRVPPRVSDFVPVPQLVDESIAAALAKRPEARPRDAHAVLRALQELERAPVARVPAFGHTTIESLVSAIENHTSAGYERYATSVGVTLAPMARGPHEGVDELLDGLGGRPPAGPEAARAIVRLAHEARREAAVRGAPPAASVSVPPAVPPVTGTPLISTRSATTADPAVTCPVDSAPTVEASAWRAHGPPILAAVAVGAVIFAIVLLLLGPGRPFGRPLVTTSASPPPLAPASLVVPSAPGAVSSIGADAAGTVLTPAVSAVASTSPPPAASTPTTPGARPAVAPLEPRTPSGSPRPPAPTSRPAAPAAAPSRRPPPDPPPKDDINRTID